MSVERVAAMAEQCLLVIHIRAERLVGEMWGKKDGFSSRQVDSLDTPRDSLAVLAELLERWNSLR